MAAAVSGSATTSRWRSSRQRRGLTCSTCPIAPAMEALLGEEVQLSFVDTVTALPYLQSGELRALVVTTLQRAAQAPAVPTIAESGLPGYRASPDFALFAPAGTPEPILRALSEASIAAMRSTQVKE